MKFVTGGKPRYDHQKRALNAMVAKKGVLGVLYDPGLGKSAVVVDYAGVLAMKLPRREARVLVICPLVAIDTWVEQVENFCSPDVDYWAEALGGSVLERAEALASRGGAAYQSKPLTRGGHMTAGVHPRAIHHQRSIKTALGVKGRKVDTFDTRKGPDQLGEDNPRIVLEVVNVDTLSQRRQVGNKTMADIMVDAIRRFDPDLVVVDESHKIKSASGNASRLLARVAKYVNRRVILTGTVMPHSALDVFGQWRFLDPYAFGELQSDGSRKQATFGGFKARYAKLGGYMGKEVIGFHRLDEMQRIMSQNSVVARKEDALDLPKTTDVTIPVELSAAEKKAYNEMKANLQTTFASGSTGTASSMLTRALRLRQITSGHMPDDNGVRQIIGNSKANTIRSLVNDTLAGEKRVVVFALFTAEIEMLQAALAEKGTEVLVVSGATGKDERIAIRKRFGSKDPTRLVLVAQIKTMSLAVNELVTASHCVFASMSQQRDDYIQGRDRLNRIGQTRPVTFWHAMVPGSVDEVILQSHRERSDLENAVLSHIERSADL